MLCPPGGMGMPGRKYQAGSGLYRYGFNGKENDNEVKGEGNQQDYGMRIYDTRLVRFLSVDPIANSYPWYTPYQFAGNMPIRFIDLDGLEPSENPKYPSVKQVVAKTEVKSIAFASSVNNLLQNPETINPFSSNETSLKGTTVNTGRSEYVTDTDPDVAKTYNMFVSNSTTFKVDESNAGNFDNYEAFVVNTLVQNMVTGQGPENYEFPTNGIMSSKFLQSDIFKAAAKDFMSGKPVVNKQYSFGATELASDTWRNGNPFNITGFTGSGTITVVLDRTMVRF